MNLNAINMEVTVKYLFIQVVRLSVKLSQVVVTIINFIKHFYCWIKLITLVKEFLDELLFKLLYRVWAHLNQDLYYTQINYVLNFKWEE